MNDSQYNKPWWELEGDEQASQIFATVNEIEQRNNYISSSNLRHLRMYSGTQLLGLTINQYSQINNPVMTNSSRPVVGLNVVQACVDTSVNNLCQDRIKPMCVTDEGSFRLQQKAKLKNKFTNGLFLKHNVHGITTAAQKNATIFGTGFVKVFTQDKDIRIENTFTDEIKVCPADSIYGSPGSLYQTRYVARYALLARYPEFASFIKQVSSETVFTGAGAVVTDCIKIVEAWHLPTSKGAGDGRHTICINGKCLFAEEWKRMKFPFAKLTYTDLTLGFYGRGIPEELIPIQFEINQLLQRASQMMKLCAVPRVFIEETSQINDKHFTSQIGGIFKYRGTPPIIQTAQSVSPEIFQQIERLYAKAFEIQGIPLLQAGGKKPADIDSGKALREYAEQANTRFITLSQKREQFHLDIAELMFEAAAELAETYGVNYAVTTFDKKDGMEKITYKDVSLKPDSYVLQVWPTNFLAKTPQGRLKDIQEYMQAGLIPREAAMDLMDFPDIEEYLSLDLSGYRLAKKNIEKLLFDGVYIPPEETDNLEACEVLALKYLAQAKLMDDSEDEENLLRQYLEDVRNVKASLAAAAEPPAPAQGPLPAEAAASPIAQPETAPTSELLPIAS